MPDVIDRQQRRAPAAAGERAQRVQHRFVFDRARDEMTASGRLERLRRRRGSRSCPASVPPLVNTISDGSALSSAADRRSRVVHRRLGLLAEMMHARRVAEQLAETRGDRLDHLGREGVVAL